MQPLRNRDTHSANLCADQSCPLLAIARCEEHYRLILLGTTLASRPGHDSALPWHLDRCTGLFCVALPHMHHVAVEVAAGWARDT